MRLSSRHTGATLAIACGPFLLGAAVQPPAQPAPQPPETAQTAPEPAQPPAPADPSSPEPAAVPESVAPPEPEALPEAPEVYSYAAGGRRDPFVSLLARGGELPAPSERPDGLLGLSIIEVALRGLVLSAGEYMAVLEAPDGRSHVVHAQDRLIDGYVREITADGVVFVQEVDDPLSLVTEREIRVGLRDLEEGR